MQNGLFIILKYLFYIINCLPIVKSFQKMRLTKAQFMLVCKNNILCKKYQDTWLHVVKIFKNSSTIPVIIIFI